MAKKGQKRIIFGRLANYGSGNSNMTFIFEIDKIFINYSQKVTHCHFGVKQGQRKLKFGMMANFVSENSNMTSIFEIDKVFINYS